MIYRSPDLTRDRILRSILLFALPILISNIFQQLYNTADVVIVGNYLGDAALAAMGSCSVVYDMLINFALGVGSGMGIVVARSFGARDSEKLKKAVAGSIVIGLILAAGLTLLSQAALKPLLMLLDTPQEILAQGFSYIATIAQFIVVTFAYNLCAGLLRAVGDSFMPLVFLIVSSVINIGLDVLFITRLGLGVQGAAYATVIAQGISAALCMIYIGSRRRFMVPGRKHFIPEGKLYGELAGQGFAMGFTNALVFTGTVILQKSINHLGTLTIAGHTMARKVNSFFTMPCATISTAVSTFVSQNRGADERERVRKGIYTGFAIVCVWGVTGVAFMALFAPALVKAVSGSGDALVLGNAAAYLRTTSAFYAVLGILFICRHALQGLGQKTIPILSSLIELVGKILFAELLIPHLGYPGVIACEPSIWCVMTLLLAPSLLRHPYIRQKTER